MRISSRARRWTTRPGPSRSLGRRWPTTTSSARRPSCCSASSGSTRSTRPATSVRPRSSSPACWATPGSRSSCSRGPRSGPTSSRACAAAATARRCACSRHVDTVLADPAEWQHDPWSGDVVDGELWGRGAIDMKSQTAAEVAAAMTLARSGWRPARGDLLVVVRRRRGDRRRARARSGSPSTTPMRSAATSSSTRAPARLPVRRRAPLRRVRRREGRLPLHRDDRRRRRPRVDAEDGRQRAAEDGPAAGGDGRRASRPTTSPRRRARCCAELGLPLDGDPAPVLDALRERDPVLALLVEPMLGVTLAPTASSRRRRST